MAEFIGEEKIISTNDSIAFKNKTESSFEISKGIIFRKSGLYEVSVEGNRTIISKVSERKKCTQKMNELIYKDMAIQTAIEAVDEWACNDDSDAPPISLERDAMIEKRLKGLPAAQPKLSCELQEFGNCSYSETGCVDCVIKEKIRKAQKYKEESPEEIAADIAPTSPFEIETWCSLLKGLNRAGYIICKKI